MICIHSKMSTFQIWLKSPGSLCASQAFCLSSRLILVSSLPGEQIPALIPSAASRPAYLKTSHRILSENARNGFTKTGFFQHWVFA